ncbi:trimeric intracellular cation channel family protein [Flexibacterium corallicola]|uniref:trimeric intracellular cation channel family protein n=1 Tax=Flexibacterium corallicola TaxID=3037259 RepID=UPI00286F0901|nr:trimeric intracellular cation channel family protein [Pseudovibrio sp. M1P-2-3]
MADYIWQYLDFLGVAVFALTGGLVAARLKLDLIAFLFFCSFTGMGGGTLRDLLLGVPIFWVENEAYLIVCACVTVFMWFGAHIVEAFDKPLRWLDAVGLSAYSVMGAAKALSVGDHFFVAILMGVATATFGGIIRDVVASQPSALIQRDVYLAAAFAGACLYTVIDALTGASNIASLVALSAALFLRGGAIMMDWKLPVYTPRRK